MRRRLLVPEVVQTSAMDCGPAALKCLLEGFGIPVSYGRLREACQTNVDGTSIDTLEDLALDLGLEAEQVMIPPDHLFLSEANALPAITVVLLPNGMTHFVVVWRRHGGVVQVMDPGTGRRFPTCRRLLGELFIHRTPVPAADFRAWAGSDEFAGPLGQRLARLGVAGAGRAQREAALADPGWRPIATLDAAARLVDALVRARAIARGREAARTLEAVIEQARGDDLAADKGAIPARYWTARPGPPGEDGQPQVMLRGAVLVRVRGRKAAATPSTMGATDDNDAPRALPPELAAALAEPPARPGRDLLRSLRADGLLAPGALLGGLALSAGALAVEALLLRALLDLGDALGLMRQRLVAVAALSLFLIVLLGVDRALASMTLRFGRRLEARFRVAFLEKIPRLGDRYFRSRPTSDMAERCHSAHLLRVAPVLGSRLVRAALDLVVTAAAIAWIDPPSGRIAVVAAALSIAVPVAAQRSLVERDLRVRSHAGALSRFYLDALLGLIAIRTHAAERSVRGEHEGLLVEWVRAGRSLVGAAVAAEGIQALFGFGLAAWLLFDAASRAGTSASLLLLVYWALGMPALGQEIALSLRQYPAQRNVLLRLTEPLGALEAGGAHPGQAAEPPPAPAARPGVSIAMSAVDVRAGGHTIVESIDLTIGPGEHIGIVGPSGAGKSSLVGLLLGWHRPAAGTLSVDGAPLDGARLDALRAETAWVDPEVHLWNRSLLDNLGYGALVPDPPIDAALEDAGLHRVLEGLPEGLLTPLGEGGGLVSGGEGQRVRLGRAMLRRDARLVILDEPFRGLDRESRAALLARARQCWAGATLLCVTHDVGDTLDFQRVLVIDGGRIAEDGAPRELAARPGTRYRALLDAERDVWARLWSSAAWRRLRLTRGALEERA